MARSKEDKGAEERAEAAAESGARMAGDTGKAQSDRIQAFLGMTGQAYRDMADGQPADVDAMVQTSARLARGMQDVGWEMFQFTQNSLRRSMRTANDMMTCRSVEDAVQIQQEFLRQSMDSLIEESTRLLEMSSSVATDALDPLQRLQRQ